MPGHLRVGTGQGEVEQGTGKHDAVVVRTEAWGHSQQFAPGGDVVGRRNAETGAEHR
ncbi:hypothetical protein D9M73_203830 [compost metagenome]